MNDVTTWIVVPTYWTFPSGGIESTDERAQRPVSLPGGTPASASGAEVTVFDHPTPLDEEGTLVRTLESFRKLDGEFHVLVVAACSNPVLGERTRQRVEQLIAPRAADLSLFLVAPPDIDRLNTFLAEPILSLTSYGNIRNVQLFVPYAAGAEVVIVIDDHEVVEDSTYVNKALEFAGRYQNVFIMKNYYMNETLKKDYLLPYPGAYLEQGLDLQRLGIEASDTLYPEYREKNSPEDFVAQATATAKVKAEEFFQYREKWEAALAGLVHSDSIREEVEQLRVG